MAEMRSGGTNLGDAIRGVLDSVERRDPEMVASARNAQAWRMAADESQNAHVCAVYTVPGSNGSEVVVYTDTNIWAVELGLQSELLRLKMNMALSKMLDQGSGAGAAERVKKLRFAASRERYRSARPDDVSTEQQLLDSGMHYDVEPALLTAAEEQQIEELASRIENPEVRAAALKAMRADAQLKKALEQNAAR